MFNFTCSLVSSSGYPTIVAANMAMRRLTPSLLSLPKRAMGTATWESVIKGELAAIKEAGTYKKERVIASPQSNRVFVEGR